MNEEVFRQISETINNGIVLLDRDYIVRYWNRWMYMHTEISADDIVGKSIFDLFPTLSNPKFLRIFGTIFAFGSHSFMSQKLHQFLIPMKPLSYKGSEYENMQQTCSLFPIRQDGEILYVCLCITDVTDIVAYEKRLILMSNQDSLTGAYNRRRLEDRLQEEFERFRRHNRPLSLIMLDIDYFKRINDTHGHQCGDFILKELTMFVAGHLRKIDLLARYGGEEFCCILPETDLDGAVIVAERMRAELALKTFEFLNKDIRITISLGISDLRADTTSPDMLLMEADDALYEAKRTGRNKVVTHPNVTEKKYRYEDI